MPLELALQLVLRRRGSGEDGAGVEEVEDAEAVDGGAVNPLPFDRLIGRSDVIVAVDVTGGPPPPGGRSPAGFDVMFGTLQIMQAAIVAAKLKIYRPQIVVRPPVDRFRILDFFDVRSILTAAEPVKDELKREIERHLTSPRSRREVDSPKASG